MAVVNFLEGTCPLPKRAWRDRSLLGHIRILLVRSPRSGTHRLRRNAQAIARAHLCEYVIDNHAVMNPLPIALNLL